MDILNVSTFYRVNPEDVEKWSILKFLDRQEYMFIVQEMRRRANG
jgi:hypothetical protein